MKRISLIILAVAAVLVGSSCSKVDDTTQNPLSLMSMSIIPDYSNGSIKCYPEPFGMSEDGLLSFKVEVLPLQYLDQFGIDDKYIYRASFRKVVTKSESDSYDFTLDGTVQKYDGDDFLTASFVLKPDVMAKIKANDYMVSFIIGDATAAQSVSTAFVPLSSNKGTNNNPNDGIIPEVPKEYIYLYPVYKILNKPTSGIASWQTGMVNATDATVVNSSDSVVTWGKEGTTTWYIVNSSCYIKRGVVCKGAVHLLLVNGTQLHISSRPNSAAIEVSGYSNSLTIYGQTGQTGILEAVSGGDGAGIGGSGEYGHSFNITINGGRISARCGGSNGAGIGGGGQHGDGNNIVINGGTIGAYGGRGGAGIGGGKYAKGENITINGGVVTATGRDGGAGIGGGFRGRCADIIINGGTIKAEGGVFEEHYASGINFGYDGMHSEGIYISDACVLYAGQDENNLTIIPHSSKTDLAPTLIQRYVKIE